MSFRRSSPWGRAEKGRLMDIVQTYRFELVTHRVPTALSLNELIAAAKLPWPEQAKVVFG